TFSEYHLEQDDKDAPIQSVPTIKLPERDLENISEIINEIGDDRHSAGPNDKIVLVVEDDIRFARIMIERAHEKGLKIVVATSFGEVLTLANNFRPIAVTLDVKLPDASGWRILDMFKNDLNFRHIPVHLVSGEENRLLAVQRGARSFLQKPLKNETLDVLFREIIDFHDQTNKRILVVDSDQQQALKIAERLRNGHRITVETIGSGQEAVRLLGTTAYDCVITNYALPDMEGLKFITDLDRLKAPMTPVFVYSEAEYTTKERTALRQYAHRVSTTAEPNFLDHLLENTVLHNHLNYKDLLPEQQRVIENLRLKEDVLMGKTILVVDDDVRNLFALTTAFERFDLNVITAESGREAITILTENDDVDIVLMDIMMPEMDGYETTQKIRREHKKTNLPIIAVTAKAMKGDREKCIDAGASDYITKPVKIDQLMSMMRIWLYK
ncbi:MAG: response regulator, partial [Bacteroidetes bacterium]|nr:response regulator [Fibrella sp.]